MSDHVHAGSSVFADRLAELREISRYLHDTVSQELVTLAFTFTYLESMPLPDAARAEVQSAQRMIDQCCREIRLIGYMLAPPPLTDIPVESAIEQLAAFVTQETGVRITCELDPSSPLSADSRALLVTAVQLWLALPIRRRSAPAILIRLRNGSSEVTLELEMLPPPAGNGMGWAVLREQAHALGGRFSVMPEAESLRAILCLPEDAAV